MAIFGGICLLVIFIFVGAYFKQRWEAADKERWEKEQKEKEGDL